LAKIAFFHPSFTTRGGAEFLCANQARRLAAHGHDVRMVTFQLNEDDWARELAALDVKVVADRVWTDWAFNWNRRTKMLARGRRARSVLADADFVIAHNYPCTLMLGNLKLDARRSWYCHEPPRNLHTVLANPYLSARVKQGVESPTDFATTRWAEILGEARREREVQKRAQLLAVDLRAVQQLDGVYANSEFTRENARAIYGDIHVDVVHPFVRFPESSGHSGAVAREGLQVLVQTRLELQKNVDSVIRGFAEYLGKDPSAILHVVGEGEMRGRLEQLAQELMPANACQFHGYLSDADLTLIYKRCDVFALLTLDEPFGMVYPEAAARGLLIVGPDHGGPFEILEGGEIGHCIDPFDPAAFGQALSEIRGLSASEADRQRNAADRSCRARFGEATIEAKLFKSFGLELGQI
jgi:glycosyltransferase involved in cell wall biosynthesis